MNIHELDSYDLGDAVKFNDKLNPRIWGADERMRPEVREQLQQIADDFQQFLGIDVEVKDITVSGSNAAYTYTPHSDIDLHLVVDLPEADRNEVYRELFDAKKYAYNDMHDIRIGGYDVELYVQDANKRHHSQGIYSIMNDDWVSVPKRRRPDVDDISVKSKFEDLGHRIESAIASGDLDKITDMAEKLRDYRQAGLDAHGEFGSENLAFKILRTQGLIKKLYDARNQAKDQLLSLDERRKKKKKKSVKYGYGAYWYPGTAYAGQDHPAGTEGGDGGGGDGGESLRESTQTSNEEILQDFVDFCVDQLKIEHMPRVRLRRDPQWPAVHRTFGRYNDDAKTLEVAWGQRHIMDVLRTVAHELTHKHQHEREGERMGPDAGETGSPYENEANARAGVLMRDYGRLHPEYFTVGQAHDLEENQASKTSVLQNRLPPKLVISGYTFTLDPATRQVTVTHGGKPFKSYRYTGPKNYDAYAANAYHAISGTQPRDLAAIEKRDRGSPTAAQQSFEYPKGSGYGVAVRDQDLERAYSQHDQDTEGHGDVSGINDLGKWGAIQRQRRRLAQQQKDDEVTETAPIGFVVPGMSADPVTAWKRQVRALILQYREDPTRLGELAKEKGEGSAEAVAYAYMRNPTARIPLPPGAEVNEGASGYIPTKAQAKDPRFSMALTQDIRPGQIGKEANKLKLKTDKQGRPQTARANGLVEALTLELTQFKKKGTLDELALRSTLPVTQTMDHRSKQIYNLKTQSGEYQIVLDISNKDDNFDDDPDYDGPTGYILDMYFVGRNSDGNWSQWNTNVGEKQVAQIFSTIAQLAVKIIKAHPEIDEIGIKGADPQRSRIYSRLMQQNIDSLLPGWKLGGEGLVREKPQQAVAEGKIKLSTDPNWYGAEVGDYKASGPVVNVPTDRLVGFEPDDKMDQPASKANVEKIVAGLKQGAKLPPLLVRKYKNGYQVLDGHHRFWAYKLLGIKAIPAQVVPDEDIEELVEDQDLDEVKMSPGALEKFATSPAARGIRAGFEAELIFRDTQGSSDDIDPEPNYDADERAYSISQVIEFFTMDEYGYGLTDRERNRLEENLDEAYMQWRDEQITSDFRNDAEDLIRDKLLEETPMSERINVYLTDSMQRSDEEADRIIAAGVDAPKFNTSKDQAAYAAENPDYAAYLEAADAAETELDESVEYSVSQQDGYWDEALDDYRDNYSGDDDSFFSDIGLRWMSDIANEYGLDWPVWDLDNQRNEGSRSWEDIGNELAQVIDMPVVVSDNYHSTRRRPGQWILEPDGSLSPDDRDEEAGLEIVSPPLPLLTAIEKLKQVTDWANDPRGGNAYTNSTTGLHMGVSLPTMKSEDATDDTGIDYVKLILFMGDKYVQQQFGREANNFCASALDKFRQNIKGKKSDPAGVVELLRHGLTELAYRELQKGVGTSKYTSAHIQNGYIEFRSPGGDWLAKADEEIGILENTMLRFARAMAIAGDPSAERQEYAKKLYKLVTADNPEYADQLRLFSEFSAGTINKEQLKKQWAETVLQKELPSVGKEEYEVFRQDNKDSPDATVGTLYAKNYDDAFDQFMKQYGGDVNTSAYLDVRIKQPWFDVFDETGKIVKTIRAKDIDTATDRAQYEFGERWTDAWTIYRRPDDTPEPKASPRAQVAKRIVAKPKTATEYNYDIVDQRTVELRVVDQFRAETPAEAERVYSAWLKSKDLPDDTANYGYRKSEQAADDQRDSVDIQRRLGVQDVDTDVAQNFSPDLSAYERNSDRIDAIRAQAQQPRQNYELVSDEDPDRVIHRMSNATADEVRAYIAQQEAGGMPPGFLRTRIVAESTGQHDDEQTQTALDMAAQDYQYKNWADVDMRGSEQAKTAIRRHAVTKLNLAQHKDFNMLGKSRSAISKGVDQVDREFIDKQIQTARKLGDDVNENFADGKVKGKSRPGRVKRAGASCNGSVTDLRRRAKNASGEKAKMYHWCANMKSGRKK